MERLRDRTDELELIISSLTTFALFSIPGWLFNTTANVYTHLSTSLLLANNIGIALITGVCYGLAACFVLHLMTRAYWVGLIGLRTVFPKGINWEKTPGIGPVSKAFYQQSLPNLDTVIRKTDRIASSLFAIISMLTLSFLWLGSIIVTIVVISGSIGERYGQTNAAIGVGTLALTIVLVGIPVLLYILDAQLAARVPSLRESRTFSKLIRVLKRVAGLALPQRLVLPVQLTIQSNTRPVVFVIALFVSVASIVVIGNVRAAAWRSFTVSDEFTYLDAGLLQSGVRSTHYEDMASSIDRLRAWPRVDSFSQGGSFARLFLPYQPIRDNLVLDQLCNSADEAPDETQDDTQDETPDRVDCLRSLWAVNIGGRDVPMTGFAPAERADLGMRGLIGLVPLDDLEPGMHTIEVVWNPDAEDGEAPLDDRYATASNTFVIPIAFSPDYERGLD